MDVDEAADWLCQLLVEADFNPERPSPAAAWLAFKRFATEPMDVQTTGLWFEAADGDTVADSPAYFDFVRMFMHHPENGAAWGEQITAHFTAPPSVQMGLGGGSVQSADVADLTNWFESVESSEAFNNGVGFTGWSFELRTDGC